MHRSSSNPSVDLHHPCRDRSLDSDAVRLAQESVDRYPRSSTSEHDPISAEETARLIAVLTMLPREASGDVAGGGVFQLGRFEVWGERGRGGFGIVLRAFDPDLQREVALKIPRPERLLDGDSPDEIIREARVAAQLEHPGIVPVFETGRWGPVWYIAAAYCAGPSLGEWLRERTSMLPAKQAAQLIVQVADAVHHAHCRGVLHLDLKPDNILLKEEGIESSELIPLVTDFGLSDWSRGESGMPSARLGGTPSYMAPEQASGNLKEIGVAADVYALGAMLADLLTDSATSPADEPSEQHCRSAKPSTGSSPDLRAVVQKCLAIAPADRYASAKELADELRRFLNGETLQARPVSFPVRLGRWARRKPTLAASLSLFAAAVSAGLVVSGLLWRQAEFNLARFEQEAVQRQLAERQIEQSVLNLARVAQKSQLAGAQALAEDSADLHALRLFLSDMRSWQAETGKSRLAQAGIDAAQSSLALFEPASADDETFRRELQHGLQAWQQVILSDPDQPHWRHALAAHLLTHHLRFSSNNWLQWREAWFGLDEQVIDAVELPYAELLVDLASDQVRRGHGEPSYAMLQAAQEVISQKSFPADGNDNRLALQLTIHNLSTAAAQLLSLPDNFAVHQAAADRLVDQIKEPGARTPKLARAVAATLARQGHECDQGKRHAEALERFAQAADCLNIAVEGSRANRQDYLELVRLHGRIGRCHRALGATAEAAQAAHRAIAVLDAAAVQLPQSARGFKLHRASLKNRLGQQLLAQGFKGEAQALFESAESDFEAVDLRQGDSKGAWFASVRALQSLGEYYAAAGRQADSRLAYERSLKKLAQMRRFTRHPSVVQLTARGEQAMASL